MKSVDYLIVGGGVAGTTAAEVIRQRDSSGSIGIVSDEPHRFYSRIMLSKPNFFLEKIPFEQVFLKNESWYANQRIELVSGRTAVALNPGEKALTLDDGSALTYQKLLLAVGGRVRKWSVSGADTPGVLYLRTLDDAKAIIAAVKSAKSAVCVGGGFVSFEMCEMLRLAGIAVTLVLREPSYWDPILDAPSGQIIERALEKGGVKIFRNAEVSEVVGAGAVTSVVLKDGTKLDCQLVIVGIGVVTPLDWVQAAGLDANRGILTDEFLETSIRDVWAAGDCAEFRDLVLGEQIQLGNWVNAQMQGRTVGLNMAGQRQPFRLVSFYTTQGFGITVGFVGDVRSAPDRTVIERGTAGADSRTRILIKEGEIIGATLVNRTPDLAPLSKLIEQDVKVTGLEAKLGDPSVDLKTLLA